MKKFTAVLLAALMCLSVLTACTSKDGEEVQRYAWPLGTSSPEDTVTQIYAEKFAEEVGRLSDGAMKIQVYPNSTIGGDRELIECAQEGSVPFLVQNTAPQVSFIPELCIFDLPCAFDSIDAVREAVDNPEFLEKIEPLYENAGLKLLGISDQGFRVMTTNKKIESLDDFKGQKIRTMENSYHLAFWKAIGASPTPMTFSEVYIGLQQGTIDAQENPYEVVVSSKFYEQQDYVIETNHLPHLITLIVSDDFYNSLEPEKQAIIDQAAQTALEYSRNASDERIEGRINTIVENGSEIVTLSDEVREEMIAASQDIYDTITEAAGSELVDLYLGK
ncbi:MAG: TRAP transporter substrate-binding protein [Clostridiales bacterium]|nr:TRAP transporter substrate-binding protein [Clostridiales bacterium]